jgi:hypothetical protein
MYHIMSRGCRKSKHTRVVIDACIPFRRKKSFPVIARSSQALDARIKAKWAADLPKGF